MTTAADIDRVRVWRRDRMIEIGLVDYIAEDLAFDSRIDWHDIAALVEQGCPIETALAIVR